MLYLCALAHVCLCVYVYISFHMGGYTCHSLCVETRGKLGEFESLLVCLYHSGTKVRSLNLWYQPIDLCSQLTSQKHFWKKILILYFEDRVPLSFLGWLLISYVGLGSPWIYFTVCQPQPPEWLRICMYAYMCTNRPGEGSTLDQYST